MEETTRGHTINVLFAERDPPCTGVTRSHGVGGFVCRQAETLKKTTGSESGGDNTSRHGALVMAKQ